MDRKPQLATQGVRAGQARTEFNEHAEALFLTSSFVFDNAEQAAARFTGGQGGMVYSRFTNPTVAMFQDRLAALEGAQSCVATASGMSAILTTAMVHLKSGDHVVCSNAVFGATVQLFSGILGRFGVETTYVSPTVIGEWERALRRNTRLLFLETPSNPLTEVSDIAALASIAKRAGALLAVDNVLCTPALQRPLELGADLVVHSATKHLDGQGRVIGGAVAGPKALVAELMIPFLRAAGPSLSPFNAWVILKGLETLDLRMRAQSAAALELARWLEGHRAVARVHYPGLASHPQHALAMRQQKAGGAVLSFDVKGGRGAAWRVIDSTRIMSIT
ncbi:MAG: O-succinylhomoserine sulfhydrylase, partial [Pseudomonadota bacterium]|nr:O-succinylhomoserine sulfhydrylase [Pseudomonadota bacterium]